MKLSRHSELARFACPNQWAGADAQMMAEAITSLKMRCGWSFNANHLFFGSIMESEATGYPIGSCKLERSGLKATIMSRRHSRLVD